MLPYGSLRAAQRQGRLLHPNIKPTPSNATAHIHKEVKLRAADAEFSSDDDGVGAADVDDSQWGKEGGAGNSNDDGGGTLQTRCMTDRGSVDDTDETVLCAAPPSHLSEDLLTCRRGVQRLLPYETEEITDANCMSRKRSISQCSESDTDTSTAPTPSAKRMDCINTTNKACFVERGELEVSRWKRQKVESLCFSQRLKFRDSTRTVGSVHGPARAPSATFYPLFHGSPDATQNSFFLLPQKAASMHQASIDSNTTSDGEEAAFAYASSSSSGGSDEQDRTHKRRATSVFHGTRHGHKQLPLSKFDCLHRECMQQPRVVNHRNNQETDSTDKKRAAALRNTILTSLITPALPLEVSSLSCFAVSEARSAPSAVPYEGAKDGKEAVQRRHRELQKLLDYTQLIDETPTESPMAPNGDARLSAVLCTTLAYYAAHNRK